MKMILQLLLTALWNMSALQCAELEENRRFHSREIQSISNRVSTYLMNTVTHASSYSLDMVNVEIRKTTASVFPFTSLVEYMQNKRPDCVTSDIFAVYNSSKSQAIKGQLNSCLPCDVWINETRSEATSLLMDAFERFDTIDDNLAKITDEMDKAVNITSAEWRAAGSVYNFCITRGQDILYTLLDVLLCLTNIYENVAFDIGKSITSLDECSKSAPKL